MRGTMSSGTVIPETFDHIDKVVFKGNDVYYFLKDRTVLKGTYLSKTHYTVVLKSCIQLLGNDRVFIEESGGYKQATS